MPLQTLRIDRVIAPMELNVETLRQLEVLEPFGTGNETPVFAVLGAQVEAVYPLGSDGAHIRLRLRKEGQSFTAICFGMTQERFPYAVGDVIDLAANCDVNVYNGEERVSVKIKTLRPAGLRQEPFFEGMRLYDRCRRGEELDEAERGAAVPERADVAVAYRWLREHGGYAGDTELLCCRVEALGGCKLRLALDVMEELGLIRRAAAKAGETITLCAVQGKVDLGQSKLLRRYQ